MCKECGEKEVNEQFKKYEGIKGADTLVKEVGNKSYLNIKGKKYGKLTAIEPAGRNKKGRLLWLFKCDCSNYVITIPRDVMRLHTTTCGCSWKEKGKKIKVGQRFGKLVTAENMGVINGKTVWRCICDCTNEVLVSAGNLNSGTRSCGCLRKEIKHDIKDLTGEEINGWKVLKRAEDRVRPSGEKLTMWLCKCIKCGKEEIISRESLREYPKICECSKVHKIPRNIEGKVYNYWTVIKDEGRGKVLARCKCGTERLVLRSSLLENSSKSCGCARKKVRENLTGQTFNYLTVLEELGNDKVKVRCKCGNEKIVSKKSMKYGSVKSCGCLNKERKYENLEGKVFTRWTVVKDEGDKKVFCRCSCGAERWVDRGNLRSGGSTSCGCLKKEQMHKMFGKDLRRMRFGRLLVVKEAGVNKHGKILWSTICDCGNTKIVPSHELLNGHTRSCGCLKREQTIERCTKPMVGKVFGRLTVLEKAYTKKGKGAYYKCSCSCGETVIVRGADIRSGNTSSCGCYGRDRASETSFKDLTGQRFGKLVVERRVEDLAQENGRRRTRFLCKCDCGGSIVTTSSSLITGETMSCGCLLSKGEYVIAQILTKNNIKFEKQKSFKDLRGKSKHSILRYDFYVDEKYLIEYDGQHHYLAGGGWCDEEHVQETQKRDELKNKYCKEKDIPLIRIPYTHIDEVCLDDIKLETTKFRVV